jgi:protein-S-isoprenylcysteine O-methyltransferase Ste14
VSKVVITGWIIELVGAALWLYGYFATGNPSLIDWQAITPWWIADCLPNVEAEMGMVLVFAGMLPRYWPARQQPID